MRHDLQTRLSIYKNNAARSFSYFRGQISEILLVKPIVLSDFKLTLPNDFRSSLHFFGESRLPNQMSRSTDKQYYLKKKWKKGVASAMDAIMITYKFHSCDVKYYATEWESWGNEEQRDSYFFDLAEAF